jgi:hypothetical protein
MSDHGDVSGVDDEMGPPTDPEIEMIAALICPNCQNVAQETGMTEDGKSMLFHCSACQSAYDTHGNPYLDSLNFSPN